MEFGEVLFWRVLLIRQIRQNKTLAKYTRYTVFGNFIWSTKVDEHWANLYNRLNLLIDVINYDWLLIFYMIWQQRLMSELV
jgi:hypothetical protein